MRVIAQAKPTSSVAAPATSALKTLDKQWSEKLPKAPETPSPLVSSDPQIAQAAPALEARNMQTYAMPATSAAFAVPPLPQIPLQQQPEPPSEERAAWDSPMVPNRQALPNQEAQGAFPAPVPPPSPPLPYSHAAGGERSPGEDYLSQNLQDSKKAFAGVGRNTLLPMAADGGRLPPYTVKAGWDIPAILEQSANSDLPGELRARVRENVYDTATGRYLLIPQNSILAGKYNSDVAYAQNRIQVNWDRLIRPGNEPTIHLNQMNGVDDSGKAGLTGPVNNHYRRLIGFALLSSAFAAGIEVSQTRNSSAYGYPTSGQMAAAAVGQQMGEFGRKVTNLNLNRPPTVELKPGTRFNVRVDRDIVFSAPWKEH
jgi:type IV secretory pathway VirB10-like protein